MGVRGFCAGPTQPAEASHVDPHAEGHADSGGAEAPVPGGRRVQAGGLEPGLEGLALRQPARRQRRGEGAQVDAHVEDREARVPAMVARRVQAADQRADARLEQSRSRGDQREPGVESRHAGDRQREMSDGDDASADEHRAARPQEVVGHEPSQDADHVGEHRVVAVDQGGVRLIPAHPTVLGRLHHEEQQQRAHAVVREALPHLRVEEVAQALGVAPQSAVRG